MTLLRALAHRPFALLWSGQTISRLGDSIYAIALAWWVLESTGSAAAMGTVLICANIPTLLFLLVGGVAVDRLPRLYVMLASDLLRGALVCLVAWLAWQGRLVLWQLFVLSALFGLVRAFFYPAYTATIPEVLPREALPSANALRSLSLQLAGIAGPALGGLIVAAGGTALAFALDGLSFFVSAACVAGVARLPALRRVAARSSGILGDLRTGFGTVLGSPWLWITVLIAGVSNITLAGPMGAALPLLVKQELGGNVRAYALLNALSAAGAVGVAVALGRRAALRRRGLLTYGSWLLVGLGTLGLGLPLPLAGLGLAILIVGAAESALGLVWTNTLQEPSIVPRERLGRVASIDALGSYALLPVGYAVAGIAADRLGAAPVFVLGGALGTTIIALGLLHPAVRRLD